MDQLLLLQDGPTRKMDMPGAHLRGVLGGGGVTRALAWVEVEGGGLGH